MSKIKKMYMEWSGLVNLLAFILMTTIIILLVDVAPSVSMVMAIVLGCVSVALCIEE